MPTVCGTLLRNGSFCYLKMGHMGECERFTGKRISSKGARVLIEKSRYTFLHKSPRIGPDYQADIPQLLCISAKQHY